MPSDTLTNLLKLYDLNRKFDLDRYLPKIKSVTDNEWVDFLDEYNSYDDNFDKILIHLLNNKINPSVKSLEQVSSCSYFNKFMILNSYNIEIPDNIWIDILDYYDRDAIPYTVDAINVLIPHLLRLDQQKLYVNFFVNLKLLSKQLTAMMTNVELQNKFNEYFEDIIGFTTLKSTFYNTMLPYYNGQYTFEILSNIKFNSLSKTVRKKIATNFVHDDTDQLDQLLFPKSYFFFPEYVDKLDIYNRDLLLHLRCSGSFEYAINKIDGLKLINDDITNYKFDLDELDDSTFNKICSSYNDYPTYQFLQFIKTKFTKFYNFIGSKLIYSTDNTKIENFTGYYKTQYEIDNLDNVSSEKLVFIISSCNNVFISSKDQLILGILLGLRTRKHINIWAYDDKDLELKYPFIQNIKEFKQEQRQDLGQDQDQEQDI